jgi:hypothetical protein
MKTKPVYHTIKDEKGKVISKIPVTEADDDWIRAARLAKKAKEGDKEAEKELRRMQNTQMIEIDDVDESESDS